MQFKYHKNGGSYSVTVHLLFNGHGIVSQALFWQSLCGKSTTYKAASIKPDDRICGDCDAKAKALGIPLPPLEAGTENTLRDGSKWEGPEVKEAYVLDAAGINTYRQVVLITDSEVKA